MVSDWVRRSPPPCLGNLRAAVIIYIYMPKDRPCVTLSSKTADNQNRLLLGTQDKVTTTLIIYYLKILNSESSVPTMQRNLIQNSYTVHTVRLAKSVEHET